MNFKDINIGLMVHTRVLECKIEMPRLCKFLNCSEEDILNMYKAKSLDSEVLLRWSRILEYDFFRIYTQNLILYAPPSAITANIKEKNESQMPRFRKNIYTKEVINFILELINSGEKTKNQIIAEYNIPKTTLYKWIEKNRK
ncbi:helix-turn-helix domain-containing protein [Chryseobacterium soli]|uniref:helix-turn-helix domain-containing protein n=1 Tax=Chryseobacterium soli TaxID=445961 RepID=UPI002953DD7B|nr:helix-turn-helix domain-containing protein [Chryseobacterium soli]MDV7699287.1 helix-turn-helix domain-containing protein [Chryseobacterium soli]